MRKHRTKQRNTDWDKIKKQRTKERKQTKIETN